jgi:cytochrome P450
VVPLAGRRLSSQLRVDAHVLPPGTDVTPAIWLAHTRAQTYPEPFAFRPERFLEDAPSTYAWIPFGGGVRRCLGAAFAEMEMRVALAEILRRRVLRPAPGAGAERVARRNVTFSPAGGTRVVALTRSGNGSNAALRYPGPASTATGISRYSTKNSAHTRM